MKDLFMEEESPEFLEKVKIVASAQKVLHAGIWLIRNGYGLMGILPYGSPSGCYWRCEFHPIGRPSKVFYRYSSGCGNRYLLQHCGGSLPISTSPRKLAEAIMVSVPENIKAACAGEPSIEMLRWLDELERVLKSSSIPEAFHEYTEDFSTWGLINIMSSLNYTMAPQPGYLPPGREITCLSEPYWRTAERLWQGMSKSAAIMIPTTTLTNDAFCFEMADRLRQGLNDVDGFDTMRILRSALAIFQARPAVDEVVAVTRPISISPQTNNVLRWGGRILAMVHELHKAGYQRIRICAGMSPDGNEWRCSVLPASLVKIDGWSPIENRHQYTSTQGKQFFGWTDSEIDDARTLARKFIERFPTTIREATGSDWAYAGWFTDLLGRVENGELPVFYQGFDLEPGNNGFPQPPPPIYPSNQGPLSSTGYHLIPNAGLTLECLPPQRADYEQLYPFCLSFDGYAGGLRSIEDCNYIAETTEAKGLANASIESLRVIAFILQRTIKWQDWKSPDERLVQRIRNVVEELRRRLSSL
jgi:hypothetical protein